jgi:hypothetical protein
MAAPSATRLLAMSAPIPFDAPVIAATLFVERSEADAEILVSRAVLSQTPRMFDLGRQPRRCSISREPLVVAPSEEFTVLSQRMFLRQQNGNLRDSPTVRNARERLNVALLSSRATTPEEVRHQRNHRYY